MFSFQAISLRNFSRPSWTKRCSKTWIRSRYMNSDLAATSYIHSDPHRSEMYISVAAPMRIPRLQLIKDELQCSPRKLPHNWPSKALLIQMAAVSFQVSFVFNDINKPHVYAFIYSDWDSLFKAVIIMTICFVRCACELNAQWYDVILEFQCYSVNLLLVAGVRPQLFRLLIDTWDGKTH